jgi:hypothetical protein
MTSALKWFRTPYSPDMALSENHLLGPLKEHLGAKRFEDEDTYKMNDLNSELSKICSLIEDMP